MAHTFVFNDVLRLRIACYTSNQVSINTAHFKVAAVGGASRTDQQVANAFDATFGPRYAGILSAGARYRGCSVQKIFPLPMKVPVASTTGDTVGTVAGDILPTQTAGLVNCASAFAGKSERGRCYLPFPGEASSGANGQPIAAYLTAIEDIAEELYTTTNIVAGADSVDLKPVIFHRVDNTTSDIVSFNWRTIWATQRRRGGFGPMNLPPF